MKKPSESLSVRARKTLSEWRALAEAVRDSPRHTAIEISSEDLLAILDEISPEMARDLASSKRMKKPRLEAIRRWDRVLDDLAYLAKHHNITYVLEARWADETGDKDEVVAEVDAHETRLG